MDRKHEIQQQINNLNIELRKIEMEKVTKDNLQLVGKCYKFRNSFSDGESWWMYKKITRINNEGELLSFVFQKPYNGSYEIRLDYWFYKSNLDYEIELAEFNAAWQEFLSELNELNKRI